MEKLKYGQLVLVYSTISEVDGIYRVRYIKWLPKYTIDLKNQIEPTPPAEVDPSKESGYSLTIKELFPELPADIDKKRNVDIYFLHSYVDVVDPMMLYLRLATGDKLFYLRGKEFMIQHGYGFKVWTSSVFPGQEATMSVRAVMFPRHTRATRVAVETVKYGMQKVERITIDSFDKAMMLSAEKKLPLILLFYPRIYMMVSEGREVLKLPVVDSFTVPTSEAVVHEISYPSDFQYTYNFVRVKRIVIPNTTGSSLTVTLSDNLPTTNASYRKYVFNVEPNKTFVAQFDRGIDFYGGIKGLASSETVVTIEGYYW